jgi:anti-sigma B factor antagonist
MIRCTAAARGVALLMLGFPCSLERPRTEPLMPQIRTTQIEPDIVVLQISGRIALGRECQQVEWAVEALINDSKKKAVFDLSELGYVDSTGIGIIVMCSGKMRAAGGELRLASLQPRILELMKMTHLDQVFHFYPTVPDAVENFDISA